MSGTTAQAVVMERTAAQFEQVNVGLQKMLGDMMGQLERLRSEWQGQGGRSFEQVKQNWAENQRRMHTALAETATAIRTAGRRYEATDAEAGQRIAQRTVPSLPV